MKRRIVSLPLKMLRQLPLGPKRLWWKSSSQKFASALSFMFLKLGKTTFLFEY